MRQSLPFSKFLILMLFAGVASGVFAQQTPTIQLEGSGMRAKLDVPAGKTTIHLCGLTPGYVYTVLALKAVYDLPVNIHLSPSADLIQSAVRIDAPRERKNALRFTAPAGCADVLVDAITDQPAPAIPLILSIRCANCAKEDTGNSTKETALAAKPAANLSVVSGVPANSLIKNTLIGGNCFEVTNITSTGPANALGTFSNGSSTIGIENGVVMCTGNVNILPGPNDSIGASGNYNGNFGSNLVQDPDLANLTIWEQWDVVKLEFDFTPTANQVKFDYVFGSEEYCEFVDAFFFNDAFGFFISGPGITGTQNLALIPNTNTPVSVNNVNHHTNTQYYVNNNPGGLLCFFQGVKNLQDCQLDGWTKVLTATANLIPCETYHIKLVIADITDELVASAVFLRANSFNAGGTAKVDVAYAGGFPNAYEDCQNGFIRFSRDSSDINTPLVVNFAISGTATPGIDYAPLTSPVTIPAGQNEVLIPVIVLGDQIVEGLESIIVTLDNPCSCAQAEATFQIDDKTPLSVELQNQNGCTGAEITLTPAISGGVTPYTYLWNTGDQTPSLTVNTSGSYTITVTDFCGTEGTASAHVELSPFSMLADTISFCPGDSITIKGTVYTGSGIVLDTLPGANGDCDTLVTYVLGLLPQPTLSDTIIFCLGDSVVIGGVVYTASGTVKDTLPGINGGCDTLITYVLNVLEPPQLSKTITFCPGRSVTIGGTVYTQAGTVLDTIPGTTGGCDTIVTYTLELLPQPTRSDTLSLCPGRTVQIGGGVFSAPATVLDTLRGINGACDTIVTYTLQLLPQPTRSETFLLCPGRTVLIDGTAFTAPGTVIDTLPGAGSACDTIVTYTLQLLPQPTRTETIPLCLGETVLIGGTAFTAPGTVVDTLPGLNGACDTIATYTLQLLLQPARAETIEFCPGETVTIDGNTYKQPGTVLDTIPANVGCDTIVTYTLKYSTPAPSNVSIVCPANIILEVGGPVAVTYNLPAATSNCPCPGIALKRTSGLASGSVFPVGTSNVCYLATDSCGNTASCCFTVTLLETKPCDIKNIGCIQFELLSIAQDANANTTYRIRVTNNCTSEMVYAAFQLPDGIVADKPADNSTFTTSNGREYTVRNPNYSPFYSIRFASKATGISGGASDIFEYTLPPRSFPDYIHAIAKVAPQAYYEAYLNTFNCPVKKTPAQNRGAATAVETRNRLLVFPNPAAGVLFADLSAWEGKPVHVQVFDSRGVPVQSLDVTGGSTAQEIHLPEGLANGLYLLDVLPEQGERKVVRFVVQK